MTKIIIIIIALLSWSVFKYIRGDYKIGSLIIRSIGIIMIGQMIGKVIIFLEVVQGGM